MKETFTVLVYGGFLPEASSLIRGNLSRKLLTIKDKVIGLRAKKLVMIIPDVSPLSALVTMACKSVNIETLQRTLTAEETKKVDLAIKVVLAPAKNVSDFVKESIQQLQDAQTDLYGGNPNLYQMKIPFAANLVHRPQIEPTAVKKVDPRAASGNYSAFDKVQQFTDQAIQNVPPVNSRDTIPDYGPDVYPDTNMAGGIQQS